VTLPAELLALMARMRLPHMRRATPGVLATAKAQSWDPAEVPRVLLCCLRRARADARDR
jgi:hypothetical protein